MVVAKTRPTVRYNLRDYGYRELVAHNITLLVDIRN